MSDWFIFGLSLLQVAAECVRPQRKVEENRSRRDKSLSTQTGRHAELTSRFFKKKQKKTKTQWLLNTNTLCFLRISFKPLCRLICHLLLLGACGFTEEDKHIRNDFPSIARFAGEKLRPPPALWREAIQQIFPLNLTRSHNVLNAVKELPISLVMVFFFFFLLHCSNGSKWICFIVSGWNAYLLCEKKAE